MSTQPCKNGHFSDRNAHGRCLACASAVSKRWRNSRPDYALAGVLVSEPCLNGHLSTRNKHGQCLECVRACTKRWQSKNRDASSENTRIWRLENAEKDKEYKKKYNKENSAAILLKNKAWREKNPDKWRKSQRIAMAKRRSHKPKWVDNKELREIYNNCPEGYQVDHIIPVNGKNVCGLHVPSNLQYLTEKENRLKSNSFNESEFLLANPEMALAKQNKALYKPRNNNNGPINDSLPIKIITANLTDASALFNSKGVFI